MICPHCGKEIPSQDYVPPTQTLSQHMFYFPIDTTCAAQPLVNPIISQDFMITLDGAAGAAQPVTLTYLKL